MKGKKTCDGPDRSRSKYIDEITALAVKQAEERGEARGRAKGKAEATREFIIAALKFRFGGSPSHETVISKIEAPSRLTRLYAVMFTIPSWDALLDVK